LCFPDREKPGGARRDRTDDLMLAKHALYQLSYGPEVLRLSVITGPLRMVGPGRLELPTLRLSGVRSNHLSYGPMRSVQDLRSGPGLAIALHHLDGGSGVERETKTAASRTCLVVLERTNRP
jgi:hypothetical protein